MGESRVGAPVIVDTHDERAVAMKRFNPSQTEDRSRQKAKGKSEERTDAGHQFLNLRRFRLPIAARVIVDHHTPVRVTPSARGITGGEVVACAGPWRTSGYWWTLDQSGWDRDEWDVELADGGVYRLARDRASGSWVIVGTVD
jgi:protein ImuB